MDRALELCGVTYRIRVLMGRGACLWASALHFKPIWLPVRRSSAITIDSRLSSPEVSKARASVAVDPVQLCKKARTHKTINPVRVPTLVYLGSLVVFVSCRAVVSEYRRICDVELIDIPDGYHRWNV